MTTASYNLAIGTNTLLEATTASHNVFLGAYAGDSVSDGSNNVVVGVNAGVAITTGASNTLVGYTCGDGITTGDYNTCLRQNSEPSAVDGTNQIVIGNVNITGKGNSTAFISAAGGPVYAGNNSADFSTTSDRRIKKNIVDNNTGLDAINQIRVRNFEYRTPDEIDELPKKSAIKQEGTQLGVIAQEIQPILPDVVKEESTGCYSVDPGNIKWYMINAIKELSAENDELRKRLDALEGNSNL